MKSRWTIRLLVVAVVAIWGVVVWQIFAPATDTTPSIPAPRQAIAQRPPAADTLLLDYADPFLKGTIRKVVAARVPVRNLPPAKVVPKSQREQVKLVHLGSVSVGGKSLYIVQIGNTQQELFRGEEARGFRLAACDRDSLYLEKAGVGYGVKLCD